MFCRCAIMKREDNLLCFMHLAQQMFSETDFIINKYRNFWVTDAFYLHKVNVYHYLCAYPPHLHEMIRLYLCDFLVLDFHKADIQHQVQLCCSFPNSKLKLITQSTSSNMSNVLIVVVIIMYFLNFTETQHLYYRLLWCQEIVFFLLLL